MAKPQQIFVCDACGYESPKWLGKCARCGGWDTMRETRPLPAAEPRTRIKPVFLADGDVEEERVLLGIDELDRVLGGGLTRGSSVLLGGDPGIGKTTLSFEIASRMVELGLNALYVSGEESPRQLAGRKKRLSLPGAFPVLSTNQVDDILEAVGESRYDLVIIDSIQSVYNSKLGFLPGSISQIRDVSSRLIRELKGRDVTHVLIGHVTKEGTIAGPKILEHMVDTVLYFEGDRMLPYRMLRAIKNRFGPVDEIGMFQMRKGGLVSVEPSLFFMSEREDTSTGSSLFPSITGSRPLILEVQAITPKTSFSLPRKLAIGYDANRLIILTAVIEKALGLPFYDRDIYVSVAGGIKVNEPGIDLAVAASVLSGFKDAPWSRTAFFGEIGLTGEIRKVVNMDTRLKECERLGVKRVFCPRGIEPLGGVEVVPLRSIRELYDHLNVHGQVQD